MSALKSDLIKFEKKFSKSFPLKNFNISFQHGGFLRLPKFGYRLPESNLKTVDFPIPLAPTSPRTFPSIGVGSLCN